MVIQAGYLVVLVTSITPRNPATQPWQRTDNTNSDAAIGTGHSATRFKDLYLSGGVYLGGTGAANKLDDYEEGTWTPTVAGGTAGYQIRTGRYTKIGNLVRLRCAVKLNSWSGTGTVTITGIPFTCVTAAFDHDWSVAYFSK
jgi:hypothetical protein